MKKTTKLSKQIIKAITVGLSASMMLQPVAAFADQLEPTSGGSNSDDFNLHQDVTDADKASASSIADRENNDEETAISAVSTAADHVQEVIEDGFTVTVENTNEEGETTTTSAHVDSIQELKDEVDAHNTTYASNQITVQGQIETDAGVVLEDIKDEKTGETLYDNKVEKDLADVISDLKNAKSEAELASSIDFLGDKKAGEANDKADEIGVIADALDGKTLTDEQKAGTKADETKAAYDTASQKVTAAENAKQPAIDAIGVAEAKMASVNDNERVTVNNDVAAVNGKVDTLTTEAGNVEAEESNAETAKNNYASAVADANTAIDNVNDAISTADGLRKDANEKFEAYNAAITAAQQAVEGLATYKEAAQGAKELSDQAHSDADAAIKDYNQAVTDVADAVAAAQSANDAVNAEIKKYNDLVDEELAKVAEIKTQIEANDVESKIKAAKDAIAEANRLADVANEVAKTKDNTEEAEAAKAAAAEANRLREEALKAIEEVDALKLEATGYLENAETYKQNAANVNKDELNKAVAAIGTAKEKAADLKTKAENAISNEETLTSDAKSKYNAAVGAVNAANALVDALAEDKELYSAANSAKNLAIDAEGTVTEKEGLATTAKNTADGYKTAYETAVANAEAAEGRYNKAFGEYNTAKAAYDQAITDYDNAKAEAERLRGLANGAIEDLDEAIGLANEKIQAAETLKGELQTEYNNKKSAYETAKNARDVYAGQLATALSNYTNYKNDALRDYATAKADFAKLTGYIDALDTTNAFQTLLEYDADAKAIYDKENPKEGETVTSQELFETILEHYYFKQVVTTAKSSKHVVDGENSFYVLLDADGKEIKDEDGNVIRINYKKDENNAGRIIIYDVTRTDWQEVKAGNDLIAKKENGVWTTTEAYTARNKADATAPVYKEKNANNEDVFVVYDKTKDVTYTSDFTEDADHKITDATEKVSYIYDAKKGQLIKEVRNEVTTTHYMGTTLSTGKVDVNEVVTIADVLDRDQALQAYKDSLKEALRTRKNTEEGKNDCLRINGHDYDTEEAIQNASETDLNFDPTERSDYLQDGFTVHASFTKLYTEEDIVSLDGYASSPEDAKRNAKVIYSSYSKRDWAEDAYDYVVTYPADSYGYAQLVDVDRKAYVYNVSTPTPLKAVDGKDFKVYELGSDDEKAARDGDVMYGRYESHTNRYGETYYTYEVVVAKNQSYIELVKEERKGHYSGIMGLGRWKWDETEAQFRARVAALGQIQKTEGNTIYYIPQEGLGSAGTFVEVENKNLYDSINSKFKDANGNAIETVAGTALSKAEMNQLGATYNNVVLDPDNERRVSVKSDSFNVTGLTKHYTGEKVTFYGYNAKDFQFVNFTTEDVLVKHGDVSKSELTPTDHHSYADDYSDAIVEANRTEKVGKFVDDNINSVNEQNEAITTYNNQVQSLVDKIASTKSKADAYATELAGLEKELNKIKCEAEIAAVNRDTEVRDLQNKIDAVQTNINGLKGKMETLETARKDIAKVVNENYTAHNGNQYKASDYASATAKLADALGKLEKLELGAGYSTDAYTQYVNGVGYKNLALKTDSARGDFVGLVSVSYEDLTEVNDKEAEFNKKDIDKSGDQTVTTKDTTDEDISATTPTDDLLKDEVKVEIGSYVAPEEDPVTPYIPSADVTPVADTTPAEEAAPAPAAEPAAEAPAPEAEAPVAEAAPAAPAPAPAAPAAPAPAPAPAAQAAEAEAPVDTVETAEIPDEDTAKADAPEETTEIGDEDTAKAAAPTQEMDDEDTPLAALPEAAKLNWWWLLLLLVFGTSGAEMYRRHLVKKNASKNNDTTTGSDK